VKYSIDATFNDAIFWDELVIQRWLVRNNFQILWGILAFISAVATLAAGATQPVYAEDAVCEDLSDDFEAAGVSY